MFTCAALLKQHEWVHNSLAIMLDHCARLTPDELARELDGFGIPSVREQLVHIAGVESFWVHAAQQRDRPRWRPEDYALAAELRPLFAEAAAATRAYVALLDDAALSVPVRVEWEPGQGVDITPALLISHVLTHSFHHKGQVVAMCRLLGYPPPETDLDCNIGRE